MSSEWPKLSIKIELDKQGYFLPEEKDGAFVERVLQDLGMDPVSEYKVVRTEDSKKIRIESDVHVHKYGAKLNLFVGPDPDEPAKYLVGYTETVAFPKAFVEEAMPKVWPDFRSGDFFIYGGGLLTLGTIMEIPKEALPPGGSIPGQVETAVTRINETMTGLAMYYYRALFKQEIEKSKAEERRRGLQYYI